MKRNNKNKQKKGVLPGIKRDVLSYFTEEEAKISSSKIVTGAMAFIALGVLIDPSYADKHENLHVNVNTHVSRTTVSGHASVVSVNAHSNANRHTSQTTSDHSNINAHASTLAATVHNNTSVHTSKAPISAHASKGALSRRDYESTNVTEGNLHNSGNQGKHTAWTDHSSGAVTNHTNAGSMSSHTNTGSSSVHSNVNTHGNSVAINRHTNASNHNSLPAINRHASLATHVNTGGGSAHASIVGMNRHNNINDHGSSHSSHSSW